MIILTIRTDKPEAELGLYDGQKQLQYVVWEAHRQLAETIHHKVTELLECDHRNIHEVEGIVCFEGPGSFTGLRIGLTVGNALAQGLTIPVVATGGEDWKGNGITRLLHGENDEHAMPEYGAEVHVTQQKK